MSREKNHLSTDFIAKITGILYEGKEDKLTPAEFVLYLLETNKNPKTGLVEKIPRETFSSKFARPHYFTEIYHKEKPGDRLPQSLVTALSNLTGTNPFFWEGTEYSIAQANGVFINMDKEIPPTTRVQHARKDGTGIKSKSTLTEAEKAFLDGLKPFAEALLIEPTTGEWKRGTFLHDAQGTLTRKGKEFTRLPEFERPHEALDQIFTRDVNDQHFALKGHFLRALVEEAKKANPNLDINVDRTQSAIQVQPHDKQERYL